MEERLYGQGDAPGEQRVGSPGMLGASGTAPVLGMGAGTAPSGVPSEIDATRTPDAPGQLVGRSAPPTADGERDRTHLGDMNSGRMSQQPPTPGLAGAESPHPLPSELTPTRIGDGPRSGEAGARAIETGADVATGGRHPLGRSQRAPRRLA
jgi:hypothetical protein